MSDVTLRMMLESYRKSRGFDVEDYLEKKTKLIIDFLNRSGIDACVIAQSGGIDSALVLYLLHHVMQQPNSPLKKIEPLTIPIYGVAGVTGQELAANDASIVMKSLGYHPHTVDLGSAYRSIINEDRVINTVDPLAITWAQGQMASVLRTSVVYYHAAMLQAEGFRSLVVGTTNKDEGSYIGFFGKASDEAVDLQPIADLHKSEVWALSKRLGVPFSVVTKDPRGDVWDNKTDEEMIGAPYWFLELYTLMKEKTTDGKFPTLRYINLTEEDRLNWVKWSVAIEELHSKNAHKYDVGNPAQFVDVMNRFVPGGWQPQFAK